MKAISVHEFGAPEVMKLKEVDDPTPAPGQLVVRIEAAGVNPVDTYIRSGTYARKPRTPYTPGTDGAGEVIAVGSEVTFFKNGDRVYTSGSLSGTYAEQALCAESHVHRLPDSVSFTQGAAIGIPYATAYRALFQKARAREAETVLVHGGTGGVGIAAIQLALAAGLTVIATGGSEKGRSLISAQGVRHVLDHHSADYLAELQTITRDKGVDIILEMLANSNLARDLRMLAPGGRVIVIGNRGTVEIDPRELMSRDAAILGMVLFNATDSELNGIHAALIAGLSDGTLKPVIGRTLPLQDAPKAHKMIMEPGAFGKIVLQP